MSTRNERGGVMTSMYHVVDAAMNLDVTDMALRGRRGVFTGHVHQAQDRAGGVPFLPKSGLGAGVGRAAQLPVDVKPERVADHRDDPVLDTGMVQRSGGMTVSGRGWVDAADDGAADGRLAWLRTASGSALGRSRPSEASRFFVAAGVVDQRADQLILTHGVPARRCLGPWPSAPEPSYCSP